MIKKNRLLQAQRISDNKYSQGREIDRNSKIHTIDQLADSRESPQLTVLDVGCGTGINANKLKLKGWKVYGVDISTVAIKKFQENGLKGDIAHVLFILTQLLSALSGYYIFILDRRHAAQAA